MSTTNNETPTVLGWGFFLPGHDAETAGHDGPKYPEKDIWVVWTLAAIYVSPIANSLTALFGPRAKRSDEIVVGVDAAPPPCAGAAGAAASAGSFVVHACSTPASTNPTRRASKIRRRQQSRSVHRRRAPRSSIANARSSIDTRPRARRTPRCSCRCGAVVRSSCARPVFDFHLGLRPNELAGVHEGAVLPASQGNSVFAITPADR